MILGISCLLIGLVAIVILQILKSNYVEGFEKRHNPCATPCTEIDSERACNKCPTCVTCVDSNSDMTCIDRKDYSVEMCPGTDPIDEETEDSSENESRKEKRRSHKRDDDTISDAIDYSITESEETAVAKEKNRQSKFLQDFQSIVHNELLNEQGMTTANSQPYLKEKKDRRSKNMEPNQIKGCPDMSEYVRKDSIPCWGCNLD
uniref:Uncharacterized protein n=1 Tax=viral metagenome TaxID=1070528 RepID=A0A6C0API5_9ZZZZ